MGGYTWKMAVLNRGYAYATLTKYQLCDPDRLNGPVVSGAGAQWVDDVGRINYDQRSQTKDVSCPAGTKVISGGFIIENTHNTAYLHSPRTTR